VLATVFWDSLGVDMDTVNAKVLQHTVKLVRSHEETTSRLFGDVAILLFDFVHLS
jgi:hypothetical protein